MAEAIRIKPSNITGSIKIPSSKSLCHRAVIAAALSEGSSLITNVTYSEDIEASCNALQAFGAIIKKEGNFLSVTGNEEIFEVLKDQEGSIDIDCNESGSTLRFLIPLAALTERLVIFNGRGRLTERPLNPYLEIFDEQNIFYESQRNGLPLKIEGKLKPGEFSIPGDISSQFITGLLFALPLLEEDSKILITTELESKPYVELTLDILKKFSIDVVNKGYKEFKIRGRQHYRAVDVEVEGDFSQAAFMLAAGVLSQGEDNIGVTVNGLTGDSHQGDRIIIDLINRMGGRLVEGAGTITAYPSKLKGITMDASECPDLVPIMAVLGALSEGVTEIINAGRLRIKESDRLKAIAKELNALGGEVKEKPKGLYIVGKKQLLGGSCDSWRDHRIAMSMAVASIRCINPVIITNSSAVKKSYPDFYKDFSSLGADIEYFNIK